MNTRGAAVFYRTSELSIDVAPLGVTCVRAGPAEWPDRMKLIKLRGKCIRPSKAALIWNIPSHELTTHFSNRSAVWRMRGYLRFSSSLSIGSHLVLDTYLLGCISCQMSIMPALTHSVRRTKYFTPGGFIAKNISS